MRTVRTQTARPNPRRKKACAGLEGKAMSAAEALKAARAACIRVGIDGDDLVMEAPARPPDAVLAAIKHNKLKIIALLRAPERPKNVDDNEWLAAIVEAHRLGYGRLLREHYAISGGPRHRGVI